jgi:hypothetical protein
LEHALETSDFAIETAIAIIRGILLNSDSSNNGAVLFWQDSRVTQSEIAEVADARSYGDMVRALSTLPAAPYSNDSGAFTSLLDEFSDEIRLERAVYIITPTISDELVNKLREMGLIYRSNVTLAVIPSLQLAEEHQDLLDYLKNESKISVFDTLLIERVEEVVSA